MNNKIAVNTYLSKITLNVNGLNIPIKRYRVADLHLKSKGHVCVCVCVYTHYLQETLFTCKDTYTESQGVRKRYSMQMEMKRKLG